MDKLGTYALVAALKEITRKAAPAQERAITMDSRTQNEKWISLRSMAQEMPQASLDPPPAAAQPAPAQYAPVTTALTKNSLENFRRIEMRHQAARRGNKA